MTARISRWSEVLVGDILVYTGNHNQPPDSRLVLSVTHSVVTTVTNEQQKKCCLIVVDLETSSTHHYEWDPSISDNDYIIRENWALFRNGKEI